MHCVSYFINAGNGWLDKTQDMIEQTKLNGPVYLSETSGKVLATRPINVTEIEFGYSTPVVIHRNPSTTALLVEDVVNHKGYIYNELGQLQSVIDNPETRPDDYILRYRFGIAKVNDKEHVYLIQNEPPISLDELPNFSKFELPSILIGYPYEQEFKYSDQLVNILYDVKATYVDAYKRPLNAEYMDEHVYLPIGIDKVTTKFQDLVNKHTHFPIVCNLSDTDFCVLDLEPGYTENDKAEAESYDVIYQEDTPRGGKHYLARTELKGFKYKYNSKLEIINDAMITFYGINGVIINPNAQPITEFHEVEELGVNHIEVQQASSDIVQIVDKIRESSDALFAETFVKKQYEIDTDLSHADFVATMNLYTKLVRNYVNTNKDKIVNQDIPWILAEYMSRLIEFRLKHNREIQGVPYLVYVASQVVDKLENN